jgi:hypothetical protein
MGRAKRNPSNARGQMTGFASAQPIQPRSSPGIVPRLARRTGRQTSGAARWAAGRRAIAGGDGATCITGGDGAPRIIGHRIGIAGAAVHSRGRCRDGGAENDCGGERDCCPARHFPISGLSCRGPMSNGLAAAALSRLANRWGWGPMTPRDKDRLDRPGQQRAQPTGTVAPACLRRTTRLLPL